MVSRLRSKVEELELYRFLAQATTCNSQQKDAWTLVSRQEEL